MLRLSGSTLFAQVHSDCLFKGQSPSVKRERSGFVVECLTRDRRAAGSSVTGVTALCP